MSAGREMLLPEEDQLQLALTLQREDLFGIFEDPTKTQELKSGRLSPHYLDIRKGISSFDTRRLVAKSMHNLANIRAKSRGFSGIHGAYDYLAGTPEAMTSYATSTADIARMGLLQPRVVSGKTAGNKVPILGRYNAGENVAAFDDVVTEGQSKIDTIGSFNEAGLEVSDYFVVLDREEGGAPHVEEATQVEVTAALGLSGMVRMLRAERQISLQQFDNVARYLDQYGEPHAKAVMNSGL